MGSSFCWPILGAIPFDDLTALEAQLKARKYAAFFVEPLQSEGGIRVPSHEYLPSAQELCRRYGTLLVLDEMQTGMFRTGPFLAAHHFGVQPDIIVLAKALSGGLVPVGAVLMTDEISDATYSSLERAIVHTSTFSENALAMHAGLATTSGPYTSRAEPLTITAADRRKKLRSRRIDPCAARSRNITQPTPTRRCVRDMHAHNRRRARCQQRQRHSPNRRSDCV